MIRLVIVARRAWIVADVFVGSVDTQKAQAVTIVISLVSMLQDVRMDARINLEKQHDERSASRPAQVRRLL